MTSRNHHHVCYIVPPYLTGVIRPDTLAADQAIRAARRQRASALASGTDEGAAGAEAGDWTVYDAKNGTDLPGDKVRAAGEPESSDDAVNEAADGITASLALFKEVYGRDSYDDKGAEVTLSVHYDQDYDNAFWDGTQLVFGDGDGDVFLRFTKPVDVLGHEFSHAVTERTAGLDYQGQSGALNESLSDCFGSCVKQRLLGQSAEEADWLIGEGLFAEGINAKGLRSMIEPGTAYDDEKLGGKDPQPADMDHYVDTEDDNGGVHYNSGIPNRAFALAAKAIGGNSWDGAGKIWYAAITGGDVTSSTDFAGFAAATVKAAGEHADKVKEAWKTVGVEVS